MKRHTKHRHTHKHKKTTPIWVGLAVIGVLLLGIVIITAKTRYTPSPVVSTINQPLPTQVEIELTNTGFNPKRVVIKPGTAVRWLNHTTDTHASVNSDDHPTHKKFPELNLGEFSTGTTLVHIFETSGTYTYHDHFNPSLRGTIVVQQ